MDCVFLVSALTRCSVRPVTLMIPGMPSGSGSLTGRPAAARMTGLESDNPFLEFKAKCHASSLGATTGNVAPPNRHRWRFFRHRWPFDRHRCPSEGHRRGFDRQRRPSNRRCCPRLGHACPLQRQRRPCNRQRRHFEGHACAVTGATLALFSSSLPLRSPTPALRGAASAL
jgi:hypothetical protein